MNFEKFSIFFLIVNFPLAKSGNYNFGNIDCMSLDTDLIGFECTIDVGSGFDSVELGAFKADGDNLCGTYLGSSPDHIQLGMDGQDILLTIDPEYSGYEDRKKRMTRLRDLEGDEGGDDEGGGDEGGDSVDDVESTDGGSVGVDRIAHGCIKIDGRKHGFTYSSVDIIWTLTVSADGSIQGLDFSTDEADQQQIFVEIEDTIGIKSAEIVDSEVRHGEFFELYIEATDGAIITDVYSILCERDSGDPYAFNLITQGEEYGVTSHDCGDSQDCTVTSVLPIRFFSEEENDVSCVGSVGLSLANRRLSSEEEHVDEGFGVAFKTAPMEEPASGTLGNGVKTTLILIVILTILGIIAIGFRQLGYNLNLCAFIKGQVGLITGQNDPTPAKELATFEIPEQLFDEDGKGSEEEPTETDESIEYYGA